METTKEFLFHVHIEREEDGSYYAWAEELPGCITDGETLEDVKNRILDAMELYISVISDEFMHDLTNSDRNTRALTPLLSRAFRNMKRKDISDLSVLAHYNPL